MKQTGKINICLVGMMGSGKSIIGKEISKIYNIKFMIPMKKWKRENN